MPINISVPNEDSSSPAISHARYTPRVAIITGASQGIGYTIAHRFADDGIDVAVNDISEKAAQIQSVVEELRKKGRRALSVPADVSKEEDVISMIEKTVKELGGVDIMVANAGIAPVAAFLDATVEQLDAIYAVNIRGVFLCYKHAARQMIKQGRGGRLIAASAAAGKEACPFSVAYSASKFAVRGLTQSAAIEFRNYAITANAYAPGVIHTSMSKMDDGTDDNGAAAKKIFVLKKYVSDAEPHVISSIVSYLVKPEAFFINGQTISVDGGWHLS